MLTTGKILPGVRFAKRVSRLCLALLWRAGVAAGLLPIGCGDGDTTKFCPQGSSGCHCFENATCFTGLTCETGICRAPDDGACEGEAGCGGGPAECTGEIGAVDGPCASSRRCDAGGKCEDSCCVACELGTEDCACTKEGTCDSDLNCLGGLCKPGPKIPDDPKCYTPCRQSFTDTEGTYHECSSEGLMEHCLDGAQCIDGSCVRLAEDAPECAASDPCADGAACIDGRCFEPPTCERDVDCPDYQRCIEGRCYSDCTADSECGAGEGCYRQVCRLACLATDQQSCPQDTYCSVTDAEHGFCLPLREPENDPEQIVEGSFSLSADSLAFTNQDLNGTVTLTNGAPRRIELEVKKARHSYYQDGGLVVSDASNENDEPLPWLLIGPAGEAAKQPAITIPVNPLNPDEAESGKADLEIRIDPDDETPSRWDGVLEVTSADFGTQQINLSYARGADGRWSGRVYYFPQFGDTNLDAWLTDKSNPELIDQVGNAFIQQWGRFRRGRDETLEELDAVITSTITESWKWPSLQKLCEEDLHDACYPYTNASGFGVYTESLLQYPVPSGLVELPVALDLKEDGDPDKLVGRITSAESLHYAGNPKVTLTFEGDPRECTGNRDACLTFLASFDSHIAVGGRYRTTDTDVDCERVPRPENQDGWLPYVHATVPFLVPGFGRAGEVERDEATGLRHRFECRDQLLPRGTMYSEENSSVAGSNPIPDGNSRIRDLALIDGMLVNHDKLYIIFKESFRKSFLGDDDTDGFAAYGLMVLQRSNAQLDASAFEGTEQDDTREQPEGILGDDVSCPADLVATVLGDRALNADTADDLAIGLLDGRAPSSTEPVVLPPEQVHYLCHDTGLFDESPGVSPEPCPAFSNVTFFTSPTLKASDLVSLDCQRDGSCGAVLTNWEQTGAHDIVMNPIWKCTDSNEVVCEADRNDLRNGKTFFAPAVDAPVFVPLLSEIDGAFRYKTRFRNRQGTNIGFVPEICVPNSNAIPYCYDPQGIDRIRSRVDCLLHVYSTMDLEPTLAERVRLYLVTNFSNKEEHDEFLPRPIVHDGFERHYAELLIMLGDESYTNAFKSRFDLAESATVTFEGSKLEPNGIDLSGVAGFEMYTLYQAAQYYELALDRFYSLSPFIWKAFASRASNDNRNFITQATVTSYFNKVLLASAHRARAWSEIAKRYQTLNRADLARAVVQRAYASAYLESIVVARMMLRLTEISTEQEQDQIFFEMDRAALTYRVALLDMRELYADFTDEVNYFGFPPDYIPLPALEPNGPNAFEAMIGQARQSLQVAAAKEDFAINSNRSFETDAAAFQAELTRIRNTYENQLAEICGTFEADGRVYPATRKYADLSEVGKLFGDPCGLVGNGSLHEAIAATELTVLDAKGIANGYERVQAEVEIERARVDAQCVGDAILAEFQWDVAGELNDLQASIHSSQESLTSLQRSSEILAVASQLKSCTKGVAENCSTGIPALIAFMAKTATFDMLAAEIEDDIHEKEEEIAEIQRNAARWVKLQECELARVNSEAIVKGLLLRLKDLDLDALKIDYRTRLALAEIQQLRNQAVRIMAEQEESEQLAINLEAARNDPNVRIYKNDAILNADFTFYNALRDAYKATRVFEYYTSQSYEALAKLGLVRLVSRGDFNLENYLTELEDAYEDFQETAGRPDLRVDILSLRDDILHIRRYDDDARAMTQTERIAEFRGELASQKWLDGNGYRVIPFATSLARLSPLTRNHKIAFLEAEIIASDKGDELGRIYISQSGTSQIRPLEGPADYYRLPERLAVLNPLFNGVRVFGPEVYRNDRLRDRPYVNTNWEFVLNQRDETVNQDIDLNSVTDIRLFVYYTDFTELQ